MNYNDRTVSRKYGELKGAHQIMMTPSLWDKLRQMAFDKKTTISELIESELRKNLHL